MDSKIILDDVRGRHQALTNLILYNDRQAVLLFRIFITVVLALTAATATAFLNPDWGYLGVWKWGLFGVAVSFAAGCFACLRAMAPADIGLAGQGADFWLWVLGEKDFDNPFDRQKLEEYLKRAMDMQKKDIKTNEKGVRALNWAKRLALASPLVGIIFVIVSYVCCEFLPLSGLFC